MIVAAGIVWLLLIAALVLVAHRLEQRTHEYDAARARLKNMRAEIDARNGIEMLGGESAPWEWPR